MIGVPRSKIERDSSELFARLESLLPSLFPNFNPMREAAPFQYPYTCLRHGVTGNSPTSSPRICWFGGESIYPPTPTAHSQVRGFPIRRSK